MSFQWHHLICWNNSTFFLKKKKNGSNFIWTLYKYALFYFSMHSKVPQPGTLKIIYEIFSIIAFPDRHVSTTDRLDPYHSQSGLGRWLLREEESSWGVCKRSARWNDPARKWNFSEPHNPAHRPARGSSWACARVMAVPDSITSLLDLRGLSCSSPLVSG